MCIGFVFKVTYLSPLSPTPRRHRIPARYMARIAQAFTTTREAVTLRASQLQLMPDVIKYGSVFTDGVGTISPALARRVEAALAGPRSSARKTLRNSNSSTCYQIRLGGYKGSSLPSLCSACLI